MSTFKVVSIALVILCENTAIPKSIDDAIIFVALGSSRRCRWCSGGSSCGDASAPIPTSTFQTRWDVKASCDHSSPRPG